MAGSTSESLFRIFNKLQDVFSTNVSSSSCPPVVPELKQLNDMVYEVRSPLPEEQPTLEIIFFHGLQERHSNEAHFTTWLSNDNSHFWLQTWLVEAFPKARILTISYDASLTSSNEVGNLDMYCTAENLVSSLTCNDVRVGETGCPVVLVGHCLGGLVLKQLCVSASNMLSRNNDVYDSLGVGRVNDLLSNMRGMFFYGTPHIGSLLGDKLPESMKSALAEEMKTLNAFSMRRNEDFRQLTLRYKWKTCGIGEQHKTFLESLGKSIHVVPEASGRAYMDNYRSIRGDHFNICKPSGKNDSAFCLLADFLQKIQEAGALRIMDISHLHRDYYIDLNGRAFQVTRVLAQPDVHTIFIKGLSGIGKTALAQQVFHEMRGNFAVTCFVSLDTIGVPSDCNMQMWQKIQNRVEEIDGRSISNHTTLLHYLKSKKVLMVVDNVCSDVQLKALETSTWLKGTRSKLIVTTTNSRLGTTSNTSSLAHFWVPYLSDEESHHLFSKYAFGNGEVPRHAKILIESVIAKCANFPLSLKIIGGYASTEDVHNLRLWRELFARMDKAMDVESGPDYRLWATLRVCFETLQGCERDLFLDVATFFHDYPSDLVKCIWHGCWEHPVTAWSNLEKRFLVSEDKDGKIQMHSQLRLLGQSIVCEQNATVDEWSRVYKTVDARKLIANYQPGTVRLPSIGLKLQNERLERLFLAETTFVPYVQLRYLILEGVEISGKNVELPTSLVYLRWTNSLFETCPVDFFRLINLVALDLTNCKSMKTLPTGLKKLNKLKWVELEGCVSLTNPFGMLSIRRLKHLGLSNTGLSEMKITRVPDHKCISSRQMLTSLDLSETKVSALPGAISALRSLTTLNVRNTKLTSLPESIGELLELQTLDLNFTPLESLPESIGKLRKLRVCRFAQTKVSALPDSIGDLSQLEILIVGGTVTNVPKTFSKLKLLKEYQGRLTSQDPIQHLASLGSLQTLSLVLDFELGEESPLAMTKGRLQAGIDSLLSPLSSLHALTRLYLHGRDFPQSLLPQVFRALQKIPCLQMLHLRDFRKVETMPDELGTLINLRRLVIWGCGSLKELPDSLGKLSGLTLLYLKDLPRLSRLPESLVHLSNLAELYIMECERLQSMPSSTGHVSSVERNETSAPNTSECPSPSELRCLRSLCTSSWSLSECFLQCLGLSVLLYIQCEEMEKVMKNVSRNREGELHVLSTKAAVKLFREMEFSRREHDNGLHEGSRLVLPHRRGNPIRFFAICCVDPSDNYEYCRVHRKQVCVGVAEDDSDSDTETEEDGADSETAEDKMDSEMGEDEDPVVSSCVHKFYTLLFSICALCSTVQS